MTGAQPQKKRHYQEHRTPPQVEIRARSASPL